MEESLAYEPCDAASSLPAFQDGCAEDSLSLQADLDDGLSQAFDRLSVQTEDCLSQASDFQEHLYDMAALVDFSADEDMENIFLRTYRRSPRKFYEALMLSPELQPVRDDLEKRKFPVMLEYGLKIFVWPDQYLRVRAAIEYLQLKGFRFFPRHVVVAASLRGLVDTAISDYCKGPGNRANVKGEVLLPVPAAPANLALAARFEQLVSAEAAERPEPGSGSQSMGVLSPTRPAAGAESVLPPVAPSFRGFRGRTEFLASLLPQIAETQDD